MCKTYCSVVTGEQISGIKHNGFISLVEKEKIPSRQKQLCDFLRINPKICDGGMYEVADVIMQDVPFRLKHDFASAKGRAQVVNFYTMVFYYFELLLITCYREGSMEVFDDICERVFNPDRKSKFLNILPAEPVRSKIWRGLMCEGHRMANQRIARAA